MKNKDLVNLCIRKITDDKYLQKYLEKYAIPFSVEDILEDIATHNKYSENIKFLSDNFGNFVDVFPLVECNMNHVDRKKLNLIRKNIDVFSLDVGKFFVEKGVIRVNDGSKDVKEIVFSTKENSIIIFIKDLLLNMYSSILVDVIDNKPVTYSYMSAQEYIERAKTTVVPIPLHKMAEQRSLDSLALLFYINQLATTRKQVKTSNKVIQGSTTRKSNVAATGQSVVNLPRTVYVLTEHGTLTRKGDITRHTDAWLVSGHWRTYKSGKKVWIDSFTKGNGEISKKIYKV